MERYVCIHGHFYQPPRENPWLEVIEQQDENLSISRLERRKLPQSATQPTAPLGFWIKIGCIERIVNNYAKMSFNFGPTLSDCSER